MGKLLGVGLGQRIHENIEPKIKELLEQKCNSRELLERAYKCMKEAKRRWARSTTNSDDDVLMAKISRHLYGEDITKKLKDSWHAGPGEGS